MRRLIASLLTLILVLSFMTFSSAEEEQYVTVQESHVTLSTPDLKVQISTEDGLSVTAVHYFDQVMFDSADGISQGPQPLMEVMYSRLPEDDIYTVNTLQGWKNVQTATTADSVSFLLSGCEELPGVTLSVTGILDQEKSSITWTGAVIGGSQEISIREVSYPRLPMQIKDKKSLFYAKGPGVVYRISEKSLMKETQDEKGYGGYPSWNPAMAYMAIYDETTRMGIYCGVHDPNAAYKKLYFSCVQKGKNSYLEPSYPAEGYGEGGNNFTLAGREVWQAFRGDWYDAAHIYREFVMAEATWLPEMDENGFLKNKSWAVMLPHWWKMYAVFPGYEDLIIKAEEDLGVPSGLHLYAWFAHPFDNDYPHYFPYKPFVPESIKNLQAAGIKVMPYINGWLWDTKDKEGEDYQFTELGKPGTIKYLDGSPMVRQYGREKNGEQCWLARMCASTTIWQKTMQDVCIRMVEELGIDGIYLDQVSSGSPRFCLDRNHDHRLGGGDWWINSYNHLLENIRSVLPENICLTSESVSEPYMKRLDVMLSWTNMWPNQVPAFAAVYGGATSFGRCYNSVQEPRKNGELFTPLEPTDKAVRMISGQSLVFGEQMGWIRPEMYFSMGCRDFYKKLVHVRYDYTDFFVDGEMLRPPFVPMERSVEARLIQVGGFKMINEKPIVTGIWQNRHTGEKLLMIINITDQPQAAVLESEYFDGGKLEVSLAPEEIIAKVMK